MTSHRFKNPSLVCHAPASWFPARARAHSAVFRNSSRNFLPCTGTVVVWSKYPSFYDHLAIKTELKHALRLGAFVVFCFVVFVAVRLNATATGDATVMLIFHPLGLVMVTAYAAVPLLFVFHRFGLLHRALLPARARARAHGVSAVFCRFSRGDP